MTVTIGVLNVQGAVSEHAQMIRQSGADVALVKHPEDLQGIAGMILPGGESTTIGKLMKKFELFEPVRELGLKGLPLFGTCAGMILMAKRIEGQDEPHLGLMDVTVNRNSFGRQRDSFEADILLEGLPDKDDPFPSVFIRAPHIVETGTDVTVLGSYESRIVAAQERNFLVTSFHPELTDDLRLHIRFIEMASSFATKTASR